MVSNVDYVNIYHNIFKDYDKSRTIYVYFKIISINFTEIDERKYFFELLL